MKHLRWITKALMALTALAVVGYLGVNIVFFTTDPFTTTPAYAYRVYQGVEATGYVVRSEEVLPAGDSDLIHLTRREGERVSRGGTVATVYADQAALDAQEEAERLSGRLDQLRYAKEVAVADEVALRLDAQIATALLDYRREVSAAALRAAEEPGAKLKSLVLKRDYTHADAQDLDAQIAETEAALQAQRSRLTASVRRLTAPASGLWSGSVDGFESVLTPETVMTMTPQALADAAPTGETSPTGKLILGERWYYAAVLPEKEAAELKRAESRGKTLLLRFAKDAQRDLEVALVRVSEAEQGQCVVVLEGETYLGSLTMLRRQRAQIVSSTVEGIRVPKEALRATKTIKNDQGLLETAEAVGVYCVVGMESRFKEVELLYSGDQFAVVRPAETVTKEQLRLRSGDLVIVQGRGLYDGKVVG